MKVKLIAGTQFYGSEVKEDGWTDTDIVGGQALIEFAGRACYQSWQRPNPKTASNRGYIEHLLDVGHYSVLEHAVATFYVTGISRSLTHEWVRHRHISPSQLSQRYVDESDVMMIMPDAIDKAGLSGIFYEAVNYSRHAYQSLLAGLEEYYGDITNKTERRKKARQAARSVLPNATETRIVMTGNLRAWRHFITLRATEGADLEIRELAIRILGLLRQEYRNVFEDFRISRADDGAYVASTPHPRE